ncbi:MAG: flagellar protein FlaG [Anaerolineales bacterium]|nr:flagellar protein FlaG [Anaerolineales bacterium]
MSDRYISSIGSSDPDYTGSMHQMESYSRVKSAEAGMPRGDPEPKKAELRETNSGHSQVTKPASVHLQFKIDPSTNDITVIVMDRESEQIIRTIPPEELNDLVEGDLLEILT